MTSTAFGKMVFAAAMACAAIFCAEGYAENGESLLEREARRDHEWDRAFTLPSFYGLSKAFTDAYAIPIGLVHNEKPWERNGRQNTLPQVQFRIEEGEQLAVALSRVTVLAEGMYDWSLHGERVTFEPTSGRATHMDLEVDLSLEDATTWEALAALREAVNAKAPDGRYLGFHLQDLGPCVRMWLPHPEFGEAQAITLDLNGVTVQHALLEILEQAPMPISFVYRIGVHQETINIHFPEIDGVPGSGTGGMAIDQEMTMKWLRRQFHVHSHLPEGTKIRVYGRDGDVSWEEAEERPRWGEEPDPE